MLFTFQDAFLDGAGPNSGVLSSVPSALARWTEEARVLDGDSVHDCLTCLKPDIIEDLEKRRDVELAERKEKRKKQAEEEASRKEKNKKEDKNKTDEGDKDSEATPPSSVSVSLPSAIQDVSVFAVLKFQVL